MIKHYIVILSCLSIPMSAELLKLDKYNADYKMSYETIDITPTEDMGLVGLNILFDFDKYWYGGLALYGAVDGKRGGFFTLGADGGAGYAISDDIQLKSGLFVGAGGGGAAPQGGGLMLRPYLETRYVGDSFSLGLGVSHVEFPNGDISSTQAYLTAEIPIDGGFLKGHTADNVSFVKSKDDSIDMEDIKISFIMEHYTPINGSLNTDGVTKTVPFTLAGVELNKFLNENFYSYMHLAAAGGGDSDGYMEVFGGMGYRYRLGELPAYFDIRGAVGASGGGRVDTGGGFGYQTQAGLVVNLTEDMTLGINGGIIKSNGGTFAATTLGASIGYKTAIFNNIPRDLNTSTLMPASYSMRMIQKSYLEGDKLFKNPAKNAKVHLEGFAIDKYLNKNIYLTGQTFWAYKGKAGGYAEGIVGAGYHSDSHSGLSLYLETLGGVGGGGGVDMGGGFFGDIGAGVAYDVGDDLSLELGGDYVKSKSGAFSTYDVRVGISYRFSLLEGR